MRLFARSTRALQLTTEGEVFLEQCKIPLALLATACKEISSDALTTSGKVRATVISPLASLYLIPLLPDFFKAHGVPRDVDDLSNHTLLQLQITGQEQATPIFVQTSNDPERKMQSLQFSPRFVCNDFNGLLRACIDGLGGA